MTTGIRSSADGSKSYIAVGGTDVVTVGTQGIEAGSFKPGAITANDFADGALIENAPVGIGYGPGAGGTVTQATSKGTSVTLNKPFGVITMHNASLAAGETVQFNLNNSLVGANDIVYAALCGGAVNGAYCRVQAQVYTLAPGIVFIQLTNQSAISLAEAVQIKFILFKGATS